MSGLVSLELPLNVKRNRASRKAAMAMVGGLEGLENAVASRTPLMLDLCPEKAEIAPIIGQVTNMDKGPRYLVALRVSRRKRVVVDGEVVGKIKTRLDFWESRADFVFARDSNTSQQVIPRRFARDGVIQALETSLKQQDENTKKRDLVLGAKKGIQKGAIDPEGEEERGKRYAYAYGDWPEGKRPIGLSVQRVRATEITPVRPTPNAMLAAGCIADDDRLSAVLEQVRQLFSRRPIWRRQQLISLLPNDLGTLELSAILPIVAYELISGPWRRTWVRFSYRPTQDPQARFLQIIERKKPGNTSGTMHQSENKIATQKSIATTDQAANTPIESSSLSIPKSTKPKKSQRATITMQFCDLDHREAQDALLSAPRRTEAHPQTGWFHKSFLETDLLQILERPSRAEALGWREFIDIAAVADLKTNLIASDDHDNDDDDHEDAIQTKPTASTNSSIPTQALQASTLTTSNGDNSHTSKTQVTTAFALLGDDDDNDDDDDDDD